MEKLKEIWIENYKFFSISVVFIMIVIGVVSCFFLFRNSKKEDIVLEEESFVSLEKVESEQEDIEEEILVSLVTVDLKGAVVQPGAYTVNSNSRVIDVLSLAGGVLENADTSVINLSKKVFDEMVIIVYTKEEVKKWEDNSKVMEEKSSICEENTLIVNDACVCPEIGETENIEEKNDTKISLNQATLDELMQLLGIGESKAKLIIEYRESNGGFQNIEDIKNVKGIGDSIFEKIKESITL